MTYLRPLTDSKSSFLYSSTLAFPKTLLHSHQNPKALHQTLPNSISPTIQPQATTHRRHSESNHHHLRQSRRRQNYHDCKCRPFTRPSRFLRLAIEADVGLRNLGLENSVNYTVVGVLNDDCTFYSPGCGGCIALHPKICQLAESNPNAIFLKVNYEELKPMCYSLHIPILLFFRFYRGAEGRVCSFSCTNATIKKFKYALSKYGTDQTSLGPAKGLDEFELLGLASMAQISVNLPLQSFQENKMENFVLKGIDLAEKSSNKMGLKQESTTLLIA